MTMDHPEKPPGEAADQPSVGVSALLTDIPQWLPPQRFGSAMLWLIAAVFVSLLLWAALAELETTVVANGQVAPSNRLQTISSLEGGILADVLVKPGQPVRVGMPLMRLSPVASAAERDRSNVTLAALNARLARLDALLYRRAPAFPPELAANDPVLVANEIALWRAQIAARDNEIEIADARVEQMVRSAAVASAELDTRRDALRLAQDELAVIEPLARQGIEPQLSLSRARSAVAQADAAARAAALSLQRAEAARNEAAQTRSMVDRRLRAEAATQQAATKAEAQQLQQLLPALSDRVQRTSIRAPVDGIVNRLLVTTIGSAVRPAEPLVEIVPQGAELEIEAMVRTEDIAFVRVGQRASIRLTAYDSTIYGTLLGRVERVGADAVVVEQGKPPLFPVRIAITARDRVSNTGRRLDISAGMVAQVDLEGERRSVLRYLLTPVARLGQRAFREPN
jgi:membrane fusion protein, adhesin transport system